MKPNLLATALTFVCAILSRQLFADDKNAAFEGRIEIVTTQGSEITPLLYTVGPDSLRIEVTGSDQPNPINVVDLKSGALTILFPHNRSFVRLKSSASVGDPTNEVPGSSGMPNAPPGRDPSGSPSVATLPQLPIPQMPAMPPGVGPQSSGITPGGSNVPRGRDLAGKMPAMPPGVGPQSGTGAGMPQMPAIPMPPSRGFGAPGMPRMGEKMELKATGKKEKLLGFNCEQYEINHGGETMEIYATDKLPPFQPYVRSRLSGFGPRMLQEQWPELLAAMKLFPLRAILRLEDGGERFRLEVKSVKPGQIDKPELFQPPEGYTEILPLPF